MLTDDAGITAVNRAVFGKDEPTDVVTTPYLPLPGERAAVSAEIFVNVERAWKLGGTPGGAARELALYIAHGLHHAAGASDRTPRLRARMRREELAWLGRAVQEGALRTLL